MRARKKEGSVKPPTKVDRKQSRGIMFENEGLRLRTIEINAEVEKGQSDLRKLKKENETLKQQVWTLRDEYDKLETFVKEIDDPSSNDEVDSDGASSLPTQPKIEMQDESDQELIQHHSNTRNIYAARRPSLSYAIPPRPDNDGNQVQMILGSYPDSNKPLLAGHHSSLPRNTHSNSACLIDSTLDNSLAGSHEVDNNTSEPAVCASNHFNLDQLLDFASSFHCDRKKHCIDDESYPKTVSPDEDTQVHSPQGKENDISPPPPNYSGMRRSSTIIERNLNAASTGVLKEVQQVSLCSKDAMKSSSSAFSKSRLDTSNNTTTVTYTRSSYYFAGSLDGRSQSLGGGLNADASAITSSTSCDPLHSSTSVSNIAGGAASSLDAGLPLVSVFSNRTSSLVRLDSIEPNTLMFSVVELPQLWSVTTQEIIDELEHQDPSSMPDVRGVRVTSRAAYISLGHRETLQRLTDRGLTIRGIVVPLIDIIRESVVLSLTGVPHYIADTTLSILLSAFGVIIGEIERRFYKGVDTGERYVRIKIKRHINLPKYVTVGGCRIVLALLGSDRHVSHYSELGQIEGPGPPLATQVCSLSDKKDFPNTLVSPDSGQCSEPSSGERACDKQECPKENFPSPTEVHNQKQESKESISRQKTFASRCVVNLKLPERISRSTMFNRISHRDAPIPPPASATAVAGSTMNAGHVLRAGSLGKSPRNSTEIPVFNAANPILPANSSSAVVLRDRPIQKDPTAKGEARSRPSSVGFEDLPREHVQVSPPVPQIPFISAGPPLMANGILRKSTISTPEQEALLPSPPQGATATIRSRLKLGRSAVHNSGKQKDKKRKANISKMESISEHTLTDESTDVTPLDGSRSTSRRDSEKSSSDSNKPKKDAIDLPWCGCWGNGCF